MKTKFNKVLSVVLVLVMCLSTFTLGISAAECTHANKTVKKTVDPTCTEWGYTTYDCPDCTADDTLTAYVQPKGHVWDEGTYTAHTETNKGYFVYTCTVCEAKSGFREDEEIKHTWSEIQNILTFDDAGNPTWTNGVQCTVCGAVSIAKADTGVETTHVHTMTKAVVKTAPTCTTDGAVTMKCTKSGCSYTYDVVEKATGHYYKAVDAVAVTPCATDDEGENGKKAHYICTTCDALFTKSGSTYSPTTAADLVVKFEHNYSWTDGDKKGTEVITVGTCTVYEVTKYTCLCGHTETKTATEFKHTKQPGTEIIVPATCETAGTETYTCSVCTQTISKTIAAKDPDHKWVTYGTGNDKKDYVETKATCTSAGFKTYTCENDFCNLPKLGGQGVKIVPTDPAKGHDFDTTKTTGADKYIAAKAATCTSNAFTAGGYCKVCKAVFAPVEIHETKLAHTWSTDDYKDVPGNTNNCLNAGKEAPYCTVCKTVNPDKTTWKDTAIDPAKHVYTSVEYWNGTTKVYTVAYGAELDATKLSCGVTYTVKMRCTECYVPVESTYLREHDYSGEGTKNDANCTGGAIILTSCAHKGCPTPKIELVAGSVADTTAAGHEASMKAAGKTPTYIGTLRHPTCVSNGEARYLCTACNQEYNVVLVPMGENKTDRTFYDDAYDADDRPDGIKWHTAKEEKTSAYVAPTCTTAGSKTWICKEADCEGTWTEVIAATGHNFATTFTTDKEATCFSVGSKSKHCLNANCNAKSEVTEVAATGNHVYGAWEEVTAPTCTAKGSEKRECTVEGCTKVETREVATLTHDYTVDVLTVTKSNPAKCEEAAFVIRVCPNCHEFAVEDYVYAEGAHTWSETGVETKPTCTEKGYTTFTCTVCGETEKRNETAALGHKNAAGELLENKCTSTPTDRVCANTNCGQTIGKDHQYESQNVAASCLSDAGVSKICKLCGDRKFEATAGTKLEHTVYTEGHLVDGKLPTTNKVWVEDTSKYVPATVGNTGKRVYDCKFCDETLTITLAKVTQATVKVEHVNAENDAAAETIVNGGKVDVKVTLEAGQAKANAIKVVFNYDHTVLTYIGIDVAKIFGEDTIFWATPVTQQNGVVEIIVYAPNTLEGKVQDVAIALNAAIANIHFQASWKSVAVDAAADTKTNFTVQHVQVLNAKGVNVFNANDINANAIAAPVAEEITIKKLGDANGDGAINGADASVIRLIMSGEYKIGNNAVSYLAAADVDFDGKITINDLAEVSRFIISDLTYEELIRTEEVVEAEKKAAAATN